MSMRGTKRASGVRGDPGEGTSKRRRTEPEDALWQLRPVSDLKMSSIYNRSASEAPAELFRKDLISAMKLPDSEPLTSSEYWVITDTWKQDWERGVQVPVNPDSLPAPKVKIIENPLPPDFQEFKLPKDRYIHLNRDGHYDSSQHQLSTTVARAEAACSYDLDATDTSWLKLLNAERARAGAPPVAEDQLERVIEELEVRCWDKIQAIMKSEEGLGIEYDENVICDVCRSPDSEDGNEMVFCDMCNICVHQACYGITVIPPGQWLCRPCGDGARPTCALCPNQGGAMKCTPSGNKWAHVSCVLWIPEVSIGCAEKMEPITKISGIPASRWSLVCVLCRERKGACIQCSVKTCKTAYHVTCAFKHGLEMRAIIEDENADDGVKLRSYCQKHSVNSKKDKCPGSGSGSEEEEVKRKRRKDMTSEEKSQARAARLQEIEREFDKHVSVKDISTHLLDVDQDAIYYIYNYWKLKRRAAHNRPLLPPKSDDSDLLSHRQEQADLDKMKMFVQLRQDLERVRNLCYMVSRREKLSRSFFRMREQTFHKQVSVLSADPPLAGQELSAIIEANHGPSIYDRLYSHPDAPDHKNDFDELLARIAGFKAESGDEKKVKDLNGLLKGKSSNPYKKMYVNGSSRRSGSIYSGLSSEESAPEIGRGGKHKGRAIGSSTDEQSPKRKVASPKKKVSPKGKALVGKKSPRKGGKRRAPQSKPIVDTSSEDDVKAQVKKDRSRSKTLQQMEKEMTAGKGLPSGSDSEELVPIRSTRNSKFPIDIYSDSSENDARGKAEQSDMSPSAANDSQQPAPRTKAAKKEFVPTQPVQKVEKKEPQTPVKKRGRKPSTFKDVKKNRDSDDEEAKTESIKYSKSKDNPTDLIVPQRQAAKKASENMRSTTAAAAAAVKVGDAVEKHGSGDDAKPKTKPKPRKDGNETREPVKEKEKEAKVRKMSSDVDKETIAYVPQRQAAKKAAAHIKSGLGSKPLVEATDEKKKEPEKGESWKQSPRKSEEKVGKSEQKSSSSSSSNSSSSSYSSSSSSEEEEKPEAKPMVKAREIKPAPRQPSLFSPTGARPTVDLPFLDRVSRPLSSTSASSDSESSKASHRSGSTSPTPKRPRRRRKTKSVSTDASPRKAPDKKLKTSERRSELGVPSSSAEGEEQGGAARAATRSRTRSTTASGNLPDKPNARQRKPSKDDAALAAGPNKASSKESGKPCQLPTPERKADEALNRKKQESPRAEVAQASATPKVPTPKRLSVEETAELEILKSPQSSSKSLVMRRQSVKEPAGAAVRERRASRLDPPHSRDVRNSASPTKKPANTEPTKKLSPIKITDYPETDKHWFPKVLSPTLRPPPVEKSGDNEKYITEDRSLDSDSIDKTSIKIMAKIQATLNENTMIKSPKTPMDARTNTLDLMDVEYHLGRNIRKRSTLETDKKFITQDASHVQGVEISKSAKIPSTVTPYPNRSMFSPQSKENDLFEFDMLSVEDGFNHDEAMIKPFSAYSDSFFFKEDSKEQGVQETQNLVDRLRMQLSNKIVPSDAGPEEGVAGNEDKELTDLAEAAPVNNDSIEPSDKNEIIDLVEDSPKNHVYATGPNHDPVPAPPVDLTPLDTSHSQSRNEKWAEVPSTRPDLVDQINDGKYEQNVTYNEELKEPTTMQSDIPSVSEIDRDTVSKQSDDSQSLSVVDHSVHSNDQESMTAENQNYDNNNSLIHSDCATISSPYVSQEKWRGESKITQRRSSASSTNSEASVCSQKTDMNMKSHVNSCDSHPSNVMPEMEPYEHLPSYSASMPLSQYGAYPEASPYMSSMPLFPGTGSALSPGPGLFAPTLPFNPSPLIPPLPKPTFPTLCAAFTSSSQNIALTTAMIAPPTPKQVPSPLRDDIDVTGSTSDKSSSLHVVSSPSVDSFHETPVRDVPTKPPMKAASESSNETVTSITPIESKSPAKPPTTKSISKGKSPGKSPGFSPKQSEGPKGSKRPNNRNSRGQRGRGRSKSRAGNHGFPLPVDYMGNSIQSKLVGTVYDFNEEIANDGVDLKSLRERRKSVDVHDRKSDASLSPHIASPVAKRASAESAVAKEASSPAEPGGPGGPSDVASGPGERPPAVVQPVLPGPVDMRTYQALDSGGPGAAPSPAPPTFHHSHLYAFASGTADQHLPDIDEEMEKQLHTALMASKAELSAKPPPDPAPPEVYVPLLPKVSLSDSRNQLKVKIKGPFLDANYSTSSVTPAAPAPPVPQHDIPSMASSSGSGTTNLRRMRKKELLRQYWTQDMNMDEPSAPPPSVPPPLARAVITIPKAVASMTSIPTREDYKGVTEIAIEKKKRKTTSGLSRELRHLEVSMKDEVEGGEVTAPTVAMPPAHKRRGRVSAKPGKAPPVAPKLKIKIGSGGVQPSVSSEDSSGFHFRPPKKRFQKPSIEDLRRESMKYRRKVMADFEEDEKVKKHKPNKSERRKKKKDKKADKLQVVNSESDSATKLIIKIKRTKEEEAAAVRAGAGAVAETPADPFEYDPSAPDPLAIDPPSYSEASSAMRKIRTAKVTPIRLKIARSAEGSGYVMKGQGEGAAEPAPAQPLALALNKHCEVR